MNQTARLMTTLAALAAVVLGPTVSIGATPEGGFKDLRVEGTFEVRTLEQTQEAADDLIRKQTATMNRLGERADNFEQALTSLGAEVAEAVNRWIEEPSPENEARLSAAVAKAALVGRQASGEMASIKDEFITQTLAIRDGLGVQLGETRLAARAAQERMTRLATEAEKVMTAALEAREFLEAKGWLQSGEIPPEWEEKVFRLMVDQQEVQVVAEIWSDVAALLDQFVVALEQADADLNEIDRMSGMISYMASSASRTFGHIGQAEALKMRVKLGADAYAQLGELRHQLAATWQRMQGMRGDLMKVVKATSRVPTLPSRPEGESSASSGDLIAWLMGLGRGEQVAQTHPGGER